MRVCVGLLLLSLAFADQSDYIVKIEALLSPANVPNFPAARPRSTLQNFVGTSHTSSYYIFRVGQDASAGLVSTSTTGSSLGVEEDIAAATTATPQTASGATTARGGLLDYSQTSVLTIDAEAQFPLFSWVAPFYPSPGWFIGQDSVQLYDGTSWVQSQTLVPLYAYTAGVDASTDWYNSVPISPVNPVGRNLVHAQQVGYANWTAIETTGSVAQYSLSIVITFRAFGAGQEPFALGQGVGAVHTSSFNLFSVGQVARGSTSRQVTIDDYTAQQIYVRSGKANGTVWDLYYSERTTWLPSGNQLVMRFDSNFPYFSFIAPLIPSPDWFIGIDSVKVFDSSKGGFQTLVIPLNIYDVGAFEGSTFYPDETGVFPSSPAGTPITTVSSSIFPTQAVTLYLTPLVQNIPTTVVEGTVREGLVNWYDQFIVFAYLQKYEFPPQLTAHYWANRALVGASSFAVVVFFSIIFLLTQYRGVRGVPLRDKIEYILGAWTTFLIIIIILWGIYGFDWASATEQMYGMPYVVASRRLNGAIDGELGVHVGLGAVNFTMIGTPMWQRNEIINYNEEFSWRWTQPIIFYSLLERGIHGAPYAILLAAGQFVFDGEGVRAGRYFREAGKNANALMWTAFSTWWVLIFVLAFAPTAQLVAGYLFICISVLLELAILLFICLIPTNYPIHMTTTGTLVIKPGWNFYTVMIVGVFSFIMGAIMVVRAKRHMAKLTYAKGFHNVAGKDVNAASLPTDTSGSSSSDYSSGYYSPDVSVSSSYI